MWERTVMPDILGILSLSIIYGFTVCSLSCLPTLSVYLMGTGRTFTDGIVGGFYFVAGKMLVYGTWGALAGGFGMLFGVPDIQNRWMGLFVIVTGLAIPLAAKTKTACSCRRTGQQGSRLPLLLLGASTSLVPCPPLAAILLLAAHKGSVLTGIGYGLVFGAGLIVSPLMAASGSMALISGVIKQKVSWISPYLQGSAMAILLVMGMRIFLEV
jgi:thiol:disulfide interchange protein DsbD